MSTSVLVLHAKSDGDADLLRHKEQVLALVRATPSSWPATVVLARDDHKTHFDGSWPRWIEEVSGRHDWYVLVGDGTCGSATAQILKRTLGRQAPTYWMRGDGVSMIVRGVSESVGRKWTVKT